MLWQGEERSEGNVKIYDNLAGIAGIARGLFHYVQAVILQFHKLVNEIKFLIRETDEVRITTKVNYKYRNSSSC